MSGGSVICTLEFLTLSMGLLFMTVNLRQGRRNLNFSASRPRAEFGAAGRKALLHWRASGAICPCFLAGSSCEAEEPVHKTDFSRRTVSKYEALPLADHAHDLKAFDRRQRRGGFEARTSAV
jgi:hypothetical protein